MKHQSKTLCQIEDGGDGRPKNNWPKPQGGEVITNNLAITQNMTKLTTATLQNILANLFIGSNAA